MAKKHFVIEIPETSQKEIYKKSCENIRLAQLKRKADIEAEMDYNSRYLGSPLPLKEKLNYHKEIVDRFLKGKILKLL